MEEERREFGRLFRRELYDEGDVRGLFLNVFKGDAEKFCDQMAEAAAMWKLSLDSATDQSRVLVTSLVFIAIKLYVESLKLFLMGHTIASGNLMRQTVETIALALLCSHKDLTVRELFLKNRYSTQRSIIHLKGEYKKVGIPREAVLELEKTQSFFHKMSHPSMMTIALAKPFGADAVFIGAGFDPEKLPQYKQDVAARLNLAEAFPGFVHTVEKNMSQWKQNKDTK